ncbi:succinate--CoA ligase subunit alpha [Pseudodesulfovibrio sp. JC047]|uniref:succinate--CoA ligase subunit alpha n=1 Tax=Pseudodesulfovibrio sp. JC047 TaxID=2683199 RepID=UPI0013D8DA24|nr:succinate--CoA ligase subunit alpha [Pseudodesulfovibrio sp. JC047]NDV18376.1 succinate--CoA ligase subunit alpha [Pseudodesulfovibrio sp. JC047]
MSILIDENTKVVVQGLTGREGSFHGQKMLDYGTKVVAGVTPGKGGQEVLGVPVFNTVQEAVDATGADTSIIFVPALASADSACEAAEAGIKTIILITEHIPVLDMVRCKAFLKSKGARLIGPNCPGVISPGKSKIGIMPDYIHRPGHVGLISRSGTLTYEAVHQLTTAGLGQSTCIGMGGDPVPGLKFIDLLEMFRNDPDTEAVCMLGEIGGDNEEKAAAYIKETNYPKPVFGFIAGLTAPAGKRMGHAGAIISGSKGRGEDKIAAMRDAGVVVVEQLGLLGETVANHLQGKNSA